MEPESVMTDKMREEFEKWALSNDGPSVSVMRNEVGRYEDEELNMAWLGWQAARTVPEAAASILADVINALENGFVRCETCGDQEDTATLDCMDDLRKIHAMIAAAQERQP